MKSSGHIRNYEVGLEAGWGPHLGIGRCELWLGTDIRKARAGTDRPP